MQTASGSRPRVIRSGDVVELVMGTVRNNCRVFVNNKELRGVRATTISSCACEATRLIIEVLYPYPPVEEGQLNVHRFKGIFIDEKDWPMFQGWLKFLEDNQVHKSS